MPVTKKNNAKVDHKKTQVVIENLDVSSLADKSTVTSRAQSPVLTQVTPKNKEDAIKIGSQYTNDNSHLIKNNSLPSSSTTKDPGKASDSDLHPTSIPRLDEVLNGGLPKGATVLLSGDAGVGKTTLAMQWLYAGWKDYQDSGLYISMTEPTTVVIRNVKNMNFFDQNAMASSDLRAVDFESEIANRQGIHFVDFRQTMEDLKIFKDEYTYKDLDKLTDVLLKLVSNSSVKRVVFDSITALAYVLKDAHMVRSFIFRMGKQLSMLDTNIIAISEAPGERDSVFGVEEFIADGVIRLSYGDPDKKIAKTLKIKKMRGLNFVSAKIPFNITNDGFELFPPLKKKLNYKASTKHISTGISGFDEISNGGYLEGASILLSGPSGSGKSLIALQSVVENIKNGKKTIYFSFEESYDQLVRNAKSFAWDLEDYIKKGLLKVVTTHPDEKYLAEHVRIIEESVSEFGPYFVVIDSISALNNSFSNETLEDFITQIFAITKARDITSLFISVSSELLGSKSASKSQISSVFDQIIVLRYVEIKSEFKHAILNLKMRGSKHSKKMYNFEFTDTGIRITGSYSAYEGVFSGSATQIRKSTENQLKDLFLEVLGPMGENVFKQTTGSGLSLTTIQELIEDLFEQGILTQDKKQFFSLEIKKIFEQN